MLATTGIADAATPVAAPAACTDGPWQVSGASVEGAPAGFSAGEPGRTYVWHDGAGWHLRTTDVDAAAHHYTGTVTPSPGASIVDVGAVTLEPGDRFTVDPHGVLHYSFTTHRGIDGVNFRVSSCSGGPGESLGFALQRNGVAAPADIDLGAHRTHPAADPFTAHRTT